MFDNVSVNAFCDNESLIRGLTDRNGYDKVYPNSTLRPDWDLIEETVQQYRTHSATSPLTFRDLQDKIRWLHDKRHLLPPANKAYFHDDLNGYLKTATEDSMRRYICQYSHVIDQAVRRNASCAEVPPDTQGTMAVAFDDNSDIHHSQGEPSHRKHRRRRIDIPLHQRITNWFKPRPSPT